MKNIFQTLSHASLEPTDIIIQFISFNWFKNYVSRFPDGEPFFQLLTQLGYSVIFSLSVYCWILFANFLFKSCHFIHVCGSIIIVSVPPFSNFDIKRLW